MKPTLFVLVTVVGIVLPANALDLKAITAKPTADNPHYGDKEAWPMLVGDEYFTKQKWDEGRTYVWKGKKCIETGAQLPEFACKHQRREDKQVLDPLMTAHRFNGAPYLSTRLHSTSTSTCS